MNIYLDHAATTPLRPEARDAWLDASGVVGNASSIHGGGQAARRVLEDARERLAATLDCDPIEVVFTSGGTEAVNLALKGLWSARGDGTSALVLPRGEHHATIDSAAWLAAHEGAEIRDVELDPTGAVSVDGFATALAGAAVATALVANNEVGTVSDAASLARSAALAGVPLHLDAVAAFGHIPVTFAGWRADARAGAGLVAMSVSSHKVGGPVGIGALVADRTAKLHAQVHGGGQQRGLRPGTQDIASAAAFAAAAEATVAELETEAVRLGILRDELRTFVTSELDGVDVLGDPQQHLPGTLHARFDGALGETLLFLLDTRGISVSTGSACQAGVAEPSHVVLALGYDDRAAKSVLRMSLGRTTTSDDIDAMKRALPWALERARAAGTGTGSRS